MSNAAPSLAEIDARIAQGEWWMTLFDALSDAGMKQVMALKTPKGRGLAGVAEAFCRLALAVRLAIAAAMRLDVLLQGLADLRRLAPGGHRRRQGARQGQSRGSRRGPRQGQGEAGGAEGDGLRKRGRIRPPRDSRPRPRHRGAGTAPHR